MIPLDNGEDEQALGMCLHISVAIPHVRMVTIDLLVAPVKGWGIGGGGGGGGGGIVVI